MSLDKNSKLITKLCWIAAIFATAAVFAVFFYKFRYFVFCCHDSIIDYIVARTMSFGGIFKRHFDYNLTRGRITLLFSFLTSVKDFVYKADSDFVNWAVQYLPILADVLLVSFIIGRKTKKEYGLIFPIAFIAFLQVDVWHSLVICYPFDFMYGLFCMILSAWLFSEYLGNKKKILMVIAVIGFYEALVVYESFLLCSLVLALIAIKLLFKPKFSPWRYIRSLLPFIITGIVYLISYVICRKLFPSAIIDFDTVPSMGFMAFLKTYIGFSTNMFPLRNFIRGQYAMGIKTYILTHKAEDLVALAAALAAGLSLYLSSRKAAELSDDRCREDIRKLIYISASGLLLAVTFALPHALTGHYQDWYINGASFGYVPSTICYFGWMIFLVPILMIFVILLRKRKAISVILTVVFALALGLGYLMESDVNQFYKSLNSDMYLRGHNYNEFCNTELFAELQPDLIYVPFVNGAYYEMDYNEELFRTGTGVDADLVNTPEDFTAAVSSGSYKNIYYVYYDSDAEAYLFGRLDAEGNMESVYFDSYYEGSYVVSYADEKGEAGNTVITDSDEPQEIQNPATVDSLDIVRLS